MTKRHIFCPICEKDLGRFHDNASRKPVRDHIYEYHKSDWDIIVRLIGEINFREKILKDTYMIGHWEIPYYHSGFFIENEDKKLTDEELQRLSEKILADD
jgi:hypothetical protein